MESQGKKNGSSSLMKRRVVASTTCLDTPAQTDPGGGEFLLQLRCSVTKYIRAGSGTMLTRAYRGSGAEASCAGTVPRDAVVDEDCVRVVMRRLLRSLWPLRAQDLTDDEWEAILPEDVLPELAGLARSLDGGSRADAVVRLAVDIHVRYNVPRVLMAACKEAEAGKGGVDGGCSICLEEEAPAAGKGVPVELPGCGHAFHRRCISRWFRKQPTCPMCRGDVAKHLDPELQGLFDDDDDPDPTTAAPALDSSGNADAAPPGDP